MEATVKKKERRGGYRKNGGRKPATDPKQSIFIWIKASVVKKHGGDKSLKRKLEEGLNEIGKVILK